MKGVLLISTLMSVFAYAQTTQQLGDGTELTTIDFQNAVTRGFFQNQKISTGITQSQNNNFNIWRPNQNEDLSLLWKLGPEEPGPFFDKRHLTDFAPPFSGNSGEFQFGFVKRALFEGPGSAIQSVEKIIDEGCNEPTSKTGEVEEETSLAPILRPRFSFEELTSEPQGEDANGNGCGYRFPSWPLEDLRDMCEARDAIVMGTETNPASLKGCHPTDCTTASFVGIIKLLQTRDDWRTIREEFRCSACRPTATRKCLTDRSCSTDENHRYYNENCFCPGGETECNNGKISCTPDPSLTSTGGFPLCECDSEGKNCKLRREYEPNWGTAYAKYSYGGGMQAFAEYLNEKYNLGIEYQRVHADTFDEMAAEGQPLQGDPIKINRDNTGHAVIFSNFRKDTDGKVTHICYWTSNESKNGTADLDLPAQTSRRQNQSPFIWNAEGESERVSEGNRCEPVIKSNPDSAYHINSIDHLSGLDQKDVLVPITPIENIGIGDIEITIEPTIPEIKIESKTIEAPSVENPDNDR